MLLVCLNKYNSHTSDFFCELVEILGSQQAIFTVFLLENSAGRCEFPCNPNNHMRARVCMCVYVIVSR